MLGGAANLSFKLGWVMEFNQRHSLGEHAYDDRVDRAARSVEGIATAIAQDVIVPVVLSGGGGSRLWPFSTKETPKQFLPLIKNKTLFAEALERVRNRLE